MVATLHQAAAIWADLVQGLPARRSRHACCLQRRVYVAKTLNHLDRRPLRKAWHSSRGGAPQRQRKEDKREVKPEGCKHLPGCCPSPHKLLDAYKAGNHSVFNGVAAADPALGCLVLSQTAICCLIVDPAAGLARVN